MGCSLPPLGGTGACYPRNLFFVSSIYLYILKSATTRLYDTDGKATRL